MPQASPQPTPQQVNGNGVNSEREQNIHPGYKINVAPRCGYDNGYIYDPDNDFRAAETIDESDYKDGLTGKKNFWEHPQQVPQRSIAQMLVNTASAIGDFVLRTDPNR